MKKYIVLSAIALLIILVFTGRNYNTERAKYEGQARIITVEQAKLISHITEGIISPDTSIAVRFQNTQVLETQLNVPLKKRIFLFNPTIEGIAMWVDGRTLVFQPNSTLKMRQMYIGSLNLEKLFPHVDNLKVKSIVIEFETSGREISDLEAHFELPDRSSPEKVILKGRLLFNQDVDIEAVKRAVILREDANGKVLNSHITKKLIFSGQEKGEEFSFESAIIIRTDKARTFTLLVEKKELELSEGREDKYYLSPLRDFTIKKIEKEIQGKNLHVKVTFSDELSSEESYEGFVQIKPFLNFKLNNMGKSLMIIGDFQHGQEYEIKIIKGLKSKWGTELLEGKLANVEFPNMKPKIEFTHSGVFLPSANMKKIFFKTVNVEKVKICVKRVFEDNLGILLQSSNLNGQKDRHFRYSSYELRRVGVTVIEKELDIGKIENKWLQSELDFEEMFKNKDRGVYIIELSFDEENILYEFPEDWSSWKRTVYFINNGVAVKPVILSDIALVAKQSKDKLIVFATDVLTTKLLKGVRIKLKSYQNQVIAEAETDTTGRCELIKKTGFYIEAEHRGQRSVLKFSDDKLDDSNFDTGGLVESDSGLKAFIYTERGVYRPGDTINLSVIARNEEDTFPENHPVSLRFFNPRDRKVIEKTIKKGSDGFYSFTFKTDETALTGDWRAELKIGSSDFYHPLKIETVVPYRLKVSIESEEKRISVKDRQIQATIRAQYLFGNPASNLDSEVNVKIEPYEVKFDTYRAFRFSNEGVDFKTVTSPIFESKLDRNGETHIKWQLPEIDRASSGLRAVIEAKVLEKGGRPVPQEKIIPIDLYKYYVGIHGTEEKYVQMGSQINVKTILVSDNGEVVPDRILNYRIYQGQSYWWWDYDSQAEFKKHFKSDYSTELVRSGTITSSSGPISIAYTPENYGEVLIEVQDGANGHTAAYFCDVYAWAGETGGKDADILKIKTDKKVYRYKDIAKVICQTPENGRALISIEKGRKILNVYWKKLKGTETIIEVPITKQMLPTVYVSISVIQSHSQTKNDKPIRMYGVVPLHVEEEETHLDFSVQAPEEINPGKEFEVEIKTLDSSPAQFTIAVVDEGLLDLTAYQTPSPWKYFFQKESLSVETFDIFSKIIGANWGDVYKIFSIGGGFDEEECAKKQLSPVKVKRFKPVSMFKGPIRTDEKGETTVTFKIPNYIGSVRVMVIGARGNSYGSKEKVIAVKSPLMVMPTLPRVLGPEDKILLPVTVFAMQDNIGEVVVNMDVKGVVKPIGETRKILSFAKKGEKDIYFELQADAAMGTSTIKISASSRDFSAEEITEIAVRPSAPYAYFSEEKVLNPEKKATFKILNKGIAGSNYSRMIISRRPDLKFYQRLEWLIRYPYGCIEQITSSVFPQLYLKDIVSLDEEKAQRSMDRNINAGIDKLRTFQLSNGGFSYWPNGDEVNLWATNYAGHFMIEANKMGYYIPEDMYNQWIEFQKDKSRTTSDHSLTNVYRVYLLALADQPAIGAMNLLYESHLKEMSNTEKWLLAASYEFIGEGQIAQGIAKDAGLTVKDYTEFAGTYGSALRDKAIMLQCATIMKDPDRELMLYKEIARILSENRWYSTQTIAYSLLAIGKYLKANPEGDEVMEGEIFLPSGEKIQFKTDEPTYTLPITQGFGQELEVIVHSKERIFGNLEWEGIPLRDTVITESKNIDLKVEWLDEDGMVITPENIEQGTAFWGHFTVKKEDYGKIEEMALVQILPAGWEIENIRLFGGGVPEWMENYALYTEDYLDIRDDRVMWFFDLYNSKAEFVVKINAVTVGEFYLSPTLAEAMYNHNYRATVAGKKVKVTERKKNVVAEK